jgi:Ca-activated chloride channel family protein
MTFATPWFAAMFLVIVAVGWTMLRSATRQREALGRLFRGVMGDRVAPPEVLAARATRERLALIGLAFAVLAAMEPRYGKELRKVDARGADLVLAVDLSRSMACADTDPTRLERAKREIFDLLRVLDGDRVGLVIYAGGAFARMPLTLDYRAVEMVVREMDVNTFEAQGSALDLALDEAVKLLEADETPAGKAILVLSDGEVHRTEDAMAAAQRVAAKGIPVHAIGIGEGPADIPGERGSVLRDAQGAAVQSTPNPALLEDVARTTGGAFVKSVASADDVIQLWSRQIEPRLTQVTRQSVERELWKEAYQLPLGLGLLLLLWTSLRGDAAKIARAAAVGLALVLVAPSSALAGSMGEADALYRAGRYQEASEMLRDLTIDAPGDAELWRRLGAAEYRAGDYESAARAFEQESRISGSADAAYNAGNAWYQGGHFDRAQRSYETAVSRKPEHSNAARNLQVLEAERQRRGAPPPPPPPPQEGGQSDDSQQQPSDRPQASPQQGQQGEEQGQQGEQQGQQGQQQGQQGQQQGQQGQQQGQQGQQQGQQGQQGQKPGQPPGQGQASDGKPGSPGSQGAGGKPGDAGGQGSEPPEGNGTRPDGSSDAVNPEDLDGMGSGTGSGSGSGEGSGSEQGGAGGGGGDESPSDGSMSATQANKLLEGVEEGRPRVFIPGGRQENPW